MSLFKLVRMLLRQAYMIQPDMADHHLHDRYKSVAKGFFWDNKSQISSVVDADSLRSGYRSLDLIPAIFVFFPFWATTIPSASEKIYSFGSLYSGLVFICLFARIFKRIGV